MSETQVWKLAGVALAVGIVIGTFVGVLASGGFGGN